MSDQRTHVEIEDVLSSIRRLVSQDGQAPRRTGLFRAAEQPFRAPVLPAAEGKPSAPDPLVLTPALRVAEVAPAPQTAAEVLPEAEAPVQIVADPPLEAGWQRAETALSLEASVAASHPATRDDDPREVSLIFDPDWQLPEPAADLHDEISRLESTIAELEAAVAASDAAFEPEQGDAFVSPAPAPAFDLPQPLAEVQAAPAPQPEPAPPAPEAAEPPAEIEAVPEPEAAPPAPETAGTPAQAEVAPEPVLEAVEWVDPVDAAFAELSAADWADDAPQPEAEAAAPRRLHLTDAAPAVAAPEPMPSSYTEVQREVEDELFDAVHAGLIGASDEALLDESALRQMVAEIVRQELQGTLGERITRSVRKLVRREIARALAGRDFE